MLNIGTSIALEPGARARVLFVSCTRPMDGRKKSCSSWRRLISFLMLTFFYSCVWCVCVYIHTQRVAETCRRQTWSDFMLLTTMIIVTPTALSFLPRRCRENFTFFFALSSKENFFLLFSSFLVLISSLLSVSQFNSSSILIISINYIHKRRCWTASLCVCITNTHTHISIKWSLDAEKLFFILFLFTFSWWSSASLLNDNERMRER